MAQKPATPGGGSGGNKVGSDVINKLEKTLKAVGEYHEQEVPDRVSESVKATGGKVIKKWIVATDQCSAELVTAVSGNDLATTRISLPITMPLKRPQFEKVSTDLLASASKFMPGSLSISNYGRLTISFEVSGNAKHADTHAAGVAWFLADGSRVAGFIRQELARSYPEIKPFDRKRDDIWRSQMGEPVKLTPEQLEMVAGGVVVKDIFKYAGGLGGAALVGVVAAPLELTGIGAVAAGAGGTIVGQNVGGAIFEAKVVWCFAKGTPVHTASGPQAIETIQAGDVVRAFDITRQTFVDADVARLDSHDVDVVMHAVGLYDGSTLDVTAGHPFLTANRGWLYGEELRAGDQIVNASGATTVVRDVTAAASAQTTVYNVVTTAGTYLVGQAGVVCSGLTAAEAKARAFA